MNPAELLPHGGAKMLLDRVISWNAGSAICAVVSHLDPANPLPSRVISHASRFIGGVPMNFPTHSVAGVS